MKIFISLSAAKGSVRMSAERIKHLLLKRKATAARLTKVKRPTEKTKLRIARNTERISALTAKLKIAVKRGAKPKPAAKEVPKAKGKTTTAPKVKVKAKRPDVVGKKAAPEAKKAGGPGKESKLKGLSKIAENRVHTARKAYTDARLNNSSDPAKLEELKTQYQEAFRSYMQVVGRTASQSSEFQTSAPASALTGRFDPIVLAYNHIMSIVSTVTKL